MTTPYNPSNSDQFDDRQISEQELRLEDILKIINRRKYGIILIMILSVSIAFFIHKIEPPEYFAESIVMINTPPNLAESLLGSNGSSDSKSTIKDIELLRSIPISKMVVKKLLQGGNKDSLEFFGNNKSISVSNRLISLLIPFINSNNVSRYNLNNAENNDEFLRLFAYKLSRRIRVLPVRETSLLKVSVLSPLKDEAVYLTNTLCEVYRESDIERKSEKYKQSNTFISEMLTGQSQSVGEADKALSKYMEQNKIYEVSGNVQQLLSKLIETDSKLNDTKVEYRITENSLNFLQNKLTEADKALSNRIGQSVKAKLSTILEEIKKNETEYVDLIRDKGINSPETKAKKQQVDQVKARYELLSRSKIAGEINYAGRAQKYSFDLIAEKLQTERKLNLLDFSAKELEHLKQYYEAQVNQLPQKQQEYAKLQRDRDVVGKTYIYLKEKLDESRIMLGSEVGSVTMIGDAFRPFQSENESPIRNLFIGFVLGGLIAFAYSFVLEIDDDTIKDEEFFKRNGLPILSHIPFLSNKNLKIDSKSKNETPEQTVISTNLTPIMTDRLSSWFAESFRALRNSLNYCFIDSPLTSIIVSGTSSSEGKSTVCSNLAIALAINDKKTIIIDCDLRMPTQHKIFNTAFESGLTDYLSSEQQTVDDKFIKPTNINNLFLMSCGKEISNPNELLSSPKMQELIKELESKFDKVIIDSPPLFLSDAAQLANSVDGILIVAQMNFSCQKPIKKIVYDFFLKPKILGIALISSQNSKSHGFGGNGYGYGYGYVLVRE